MIEWPEYFTQDEFDSPDLPGSGSCMNHDFLRRFFAMREYCGFPFRINRAVSTVEHNRKVGGVENSSHLILREGGVVAVDVHHGAHPFKMAKMLKAAYDQDITRIGIGLTYFHFDYDQNKNQWRIWFYYPGKKQVIKAKKIFNKLTGKISTKSIEDWDK